MTGHSSDIYKTLFDLSDEAMMIMSSDTIVRCNEACRKLFQADSEDQILGLHPSELSPYLQKDGTLSKEKAGNMIGDCHEKGYHRFEWIHKRFNGNDFEAEVSLTSFMDQGKQLVYAVIRDKTDFLDTDYLRHFAEEKLKLIANNTEDIIWIRDLRFRYTYLSPSIERVKGFTVDEALKLGATETVFREDVKAALSALKEELRNDEKEDVDKARSRRFQMREYHKNGTLIWTEQSMSFIRDLNEKPIGLMGITRDITEQKRIHDELEFAKKKAEESDALKSSFLANMSHEIRTPLNAILGFSDLFLDEDTDLEEKEQFRSIIHQSSDKLLTIISDIFDISKLETDQLRLKTRSHSLLDIINKFGNYPERLEDELKANKSFQVIISGDWDQQKFILDGERLQQLIVNLLHNAYKFSDQGQIALTLSKPSEGIAKVQVIDEGKGISHEDIDLIFVRFRQAHESYDRKFGGTGLGLAICKGLVELMDGEIGVSSSPNKGSEFWFTIPLVPAIES